MNYVDIVLDCPTNGGMGGAMDPMDIKRWRPQTFGDFIGAANTRPLQRLQRAAIARRLPPALLIIGPYGCSKTSLARLLLMAYGCQRPDPATGDPCHRCDECLRQGVEYNGEGLTYRHWEVDCTR